MRYRRAVTRHEAITRADLGAAGATDPLTALLAADSPEDSLSLLPSAVRRAGELAEQLRAAVALRSRSSDPLLVELCAQMKAAAGAHEAFVATWSGTADLGVISQSMLDDDVCRLTRTWASMIQVILDATDPRGADLPVEA